MANLIVVEDGNEHQLLFEVGPDAGGRSAGQVGISDWLKDTVYGSGNDQHPGQIADIATTIGSLADGVTSSFEGLATDKADGGKVSSLKLEFGIKVSAKGNTFVTKVGAQANLKIAIEWDFS